jgi:ubiquinone/menaquinone biosynthesis C-methylase UbiE
MNKFLDKLIRYFRVKKILPHITKDKTRILDLGCGPRPWFFDLDLSHLKNKEIVAVDKVEYKYPQDVSFQFITSDVENSLPFPNDSFDLITALALIEHLKNYRSFLEEVFRILKPGGYFILTTPSPLAKPVLEFLAFKLHLIDEDSIADHKHYFDKNELKNLLSNAGFKIIDIKSFEFGFNIFIKATK